MSVCESCIVASEKLHFIEGHPAAYKEIICGVTGKAYAHGYSYLKPTRREGTPPPFPDTCPYAPILKLLMEAVEVSSEEKMKTTKHVFGEMAIQDLKAKGWERVEFWIRRKP